MATKTAKTTRAAVKSAAPRAGCACGCGATPAGRRSVYLPGHDTKHRSAMKAAHPRRKIRFVWDDEKRATRAAKLRAYRASRREATAA